MKIPPYGKPLYEFIKDGYKPTNSVNIFIGHGAWEKGKNFSLSYPERTLVLPPLLSPIEYYWPVTKCDILVHDVFFTEQDYIDRLVYSLYEHEAHIVRLIDCDRNLIVYHKE